MKYTPEFLSKITKGYKSISDFKKDHSNVYVAICRKGLREKYLGHMKGISDTAKLSKDDIYKIASKYKTLKEFRESEPKAVGRAKYFKIYKDVIKNLERGSTLKWSKDALSKEAKKYKSAKEFYSKSKSAYTTMMRLGVKDIVATHLS